MLGPAAHKFESFGENAEPSETLLGVCFRCHTCTIAQEDADGMVAFK